MKAHVFSNPFQTQGNPDSISSLPPWLTPRLAGALAALLAALLTVLLAALVFAPAAAAAEKDYEIQQAATAEMHEDDAQPTAAAAARAKPEKNDDRGKPVSVTAGKVENEARPASTAYSVGDNLQPAADAAQRKGAPAAVQGEEKSGAPEDAGI